MLVANYKTKKMLKEAVGKKLNYTETTMFGIYEFVENGKMNVVGPAAYNRDWYAEVWNENGLIVKVS